MPATDLDQIVNLCKRRGFVYPSAEIYGGFRSAYDYGPLGALMLRNVKDAWVRAMVQERDDVVLIDAAVLGPPQVWEASGHLANFTDPLVDCTNCKNRFRLDKLDDPDTCPSCGKHGTFTEARQFNLMFKTQAGPVEDSAAVGLPAPGDGAGHVRQLRQRAADDAARSRRSASPRSARRSATRSRRRTGSSAPASSSRWRWSSSSPPADERRSGTSTGATSGWTGTSATASRPTCCACARTSADELSHYSAGTADVEFRFPWGFDELEGIAQRTDYDLRAHAEHSGERLDYFDQADQRALRAVRHRAGGRRHPHDGRLPAAAYDEDVINGEDRTVLRLHPRLAPYQVAVLPLSQEGHADAAGPRDPQGAEPAVHGRLRRDPGDRPPLPPAGRDRHAAGVTVDFDSLEDKAGDDPRPGHHRAGPRPRSTTSSPRSPTASGSESPK